MNDSFKHLRIIFLNQMVGLLFRELAEDISKEWSPSLLFTGHPDTLWSDRTDSLSIMAAPEYKRKNYLSRLLSGIRYVFYVLLRCWRLPRSTLLFLVSNPPFLGLIGYLFRRLRGQHYVVLVYDIYPDMLVQFGSLRESGLIARLWRRMNRVIWENAEIAFTIGDKMASNMKQQFDASKTLPGKVIVIPTWANTNWIRPVAKDKNEFAKKYGQVGKLTVMYSGNLGKTHDIETILAAAEELKEYDSIHFMIIGEGAKKNLVEKAKYKGGLDNLTILPFQPEELLPASLPTADIAIITLDKGCEGLSVPSKTHYYMAAGSALLGICDNNSEVAQIIKRHECGIVIRPGDIDTFVSEVLSLSKDKTKLNYYQANSRRAAENFYSRRNTRQYVEALSAVSALPRR
jgi:glycosyltransferase involved in cell wall biosynthesis